MKNIIILALLFIANTTSSFAAKTTPVVASAPSTAPCSVYVSNNNLVVETKGLAEVTVTGKYGNEISKTNIKNRQQIPMKDLQQGKYTIKVKTEGKESNIKLDVL